MDRASPSTSSSPSRSTSRSRSTSTSTSTRTTRRLRRPGLRPVRPAEGSIGLEIPGHIPRCRCAMPGPVSTPASAPSANPALAPAHATVLTSARPLVAARRRPVCSSGPPLLDSSAIGLRPISARPAIGLARVGSSIQSRGTSRTEGGQRGRWTRLQRASVLSGCCGLDE
jgi:hypothetical protein